MPGVTELRAGVYAFQDLKQVSLGPATLDDCALTVMATVVSHARPDRYVLDAGIKALAGEDYGWGTWGRPQDRPDLAIIRATEEHGVIELPAGRRGPGLADRRARADHPEPRLWRGEHARRARRDRRRAGASSTGRSSAAGGSARWPTRRPTAARGFVDVHAVFGPDHGTAGTAGAPLDALVAERRVARDPPVAGLLAARARGPTARPATGSPPRPRRTRRTASRPSRSSVRGGPAHAGAARRRGRARRAPSATGSMAGTASAPPPESVREVLRAVARDRPAAARADRAVFGAASVDRRRDRGLGIPVVLLGAHYMPHRRRPAPPRSATRTSTSRRAPWRTTGRSRRPSRTIGARAAAARDGQSGPGRRHRRSARSSLASIPDDAKRAILGRQRRPAVRPGRTDRST